MNENKKHPVNEQDPVGEHKEEIDLSIGNEGTADAGFSSSEPTPELEKDGRGNDGDKKEADDNGINPGPEDMYPAQKDPGMAPRIENADEDELNPYPDEMKPDLNKDQDHNSPAR